MEKLFPLVTVHDAMRSAQEKRAESAAMIQYTFRIPEPLRERAKFICDQHGVDLAEFLRECCLGLVKDYAPNLKL